MDSGAEKLNTGVHPHGAKWWRFRYEHSFIEVLQWMLCRCLCPCCGVWGFMLAQALLMIWILVFMLIWEEVFTRLRIKASIYFYVCAARRASREEQEGPGRREEFGHGIATKVSFGCDIDLLLLLLEANKAANIEGKSHNIALEGTMYIHWVALLRCTSWGLLSGSPPLYSSSECQ
eukprot:4292727-Amphidinium_carterae.1